MSNKQFKSFRDSTLPERVVEALRTGRPIIRMVNLRDDRGLKNPVGVQVQQLVHRDVTLTSSSGSGAKSLSLIMNIGEDNVGNSLNIVNATAWVNFTTEKANKLLKKYIGKGNFSYSAIDDEEILFADTVMDYEDLQIEVWENFEEENNPSSAKINPATGEIVTAQFTGELSDGTVVEGEDIQVYRHTTIVVEEAGHNFIDPNGVYEGSSVHPTLVKDKRRSLARVA